MVNNIKYLTLLVLSFSTIQTYGNCADESEFQKLLDPDHVYSIVYNIQKTLVTEIKDMVLANPLTILNPPKVETTRAKLENLEEELTNISAAKLRLDPKNATSGPCNFFQLSVQTRGLKNSVTEIAHCIQSSCSKDAQAAITEELFLKTTRLDKDNSACLESLPRPDEPGPEESRK